MNKLLIFALLLAPAFAQELPTVNQCRADRQAWGSSMMDETRKLPFDEVERRLKELHMCGWVVDQSRRANYFSFAPIFEQEEKSRMFSYLYRHGYWQKFLDEDDHGQR